MGEEHYSRPCRVASDGRDSGDVLESAWVLPRLHEVFGELLDAGFRGGRHVLSSECTFEQQEVLLRKNWLTTNTAIQLARLYRGRIREAVVHVVGQSVRM